MKEWFDEYALGMTYIYYKLLQQMLPGVVATLLRHRAYDAEVSGSSPGDDVIFFS